MRCFSLLLLSVAVLVFPAGGGSAARVGGASASGAEYVNFKLPSGNIGCGYSRFVGETALLRCEIVSLLRPLPPKPAACTEGVWGRAVSARPRGRAGVGCIGDTVIEPRAPVLAYGQRWRRGGFTCRSRVSGLTCTNRDGHGWFLSRERSRLF